jgi:hypothetical protein
MTLLSLFELVFNFSALQARSSSAEKRHPKWYNIACTTNQYYQRRSYLNTATKITELPALTADLLQSKYYTI